MNIEVYVVVRFSAPVIKEHQSEINETQLARENWFQMRAQLFFNTTAQSFKEQMNEINKIFLIFSKGDELLFKKYFNDLWLKTLKVEPIFLSDPTDTTDITYLTKISNNFARYTTSPIIVSRVDSDDLVANDYYKNIKKYINDEELKEPKFVVCTNGNRTDLEYVQKTPYKKSPFICSYYPANYFSTGKKIISTGGDHDKIPDADCIFTDQTSWTQIVHGTNLSNRFVLRPLKRVSLRSWPRNTYYPDEGFNNRIKTKKTMKLFILKLPFIVSFVNFVLKR